MHAILKKQKLSWRLKLPTFCLHFLYGGFCYLNIELTIEIKGIECLTKVMIVFYFVSIRPPPEFLPVFGPLKWYMTPTLDAALLCIVHRDWVTTISSRAGADLG